MAGADGGGAGEGAISAERAARIEHRIVDDLYKRGMASNVGMAVALVVIGSFVIGPGGLGVRVALGVLAGLIAARLVLYSLDRAGRNPFPSPRGREAAFHVGVGATGVALGALMAVAYPRLEPAQSALLATCATGVVAAGLSSLGSSAVAFLLYAVPNLTALGVMTALDDRGWGEKTLLALLCVYLPTVTAISLQQARLRRHAIVLELELTDQALRDPLTGLFNRRFFGVLLDKEAAAAESSCVFQDRRKPLRVVALGLLVIDLDHFKRVNDEHGHDAGDLVLKEVGALIARSIRKCDEAVRWGGEEFAVVLRVPWEDRHQVELVVNRILSTLRKQEFRLAGGKVLKQTASIGWTLHPLSDRNPTVMSWEASLRLADQALYIAKVEGRDRSVGVLGGPELTSNPDGLAETLVGSLASAEKAGLIRVVRPA